MNGEGNVVVGPHGLRGGDASAEDLVVEQPLHRLGELQVPQPLGPVESQRDVVEVLRAEAGLHADVHSLVVVLELDIEVEEAADVAVHRVFDLIRVDVPVGQETGLGSGEDLGDDGLGLGVHLDELDVPGVLAGGGSIPDGGVALFRNGHGGAASPGAGVLLGHAFLVVPFALEVIAGGLGLVFHLSNYLLPN